METVDPPPRSDWAKFLTMAIALVVISAILGALLWVVLANRSQISEKEMRSWMARFAVLCVALLGLTLVVLFWIIVRFAGSRMQMPAARSRTEHVDAWSLAGQRMKVEDAGEEREPGEDGDGSQG